MKMKLILLALSFVAMVNVNAQDDKKSVREEKKEEMEAQKVAFITTQLDLTADESKVFWPVYNEREKEMKEIRKELRENFKEGKDMDDMTDAEVKKMMEDILALKKKELEIEEKYNTKFQTVLPIKKVAKLHHAERKFNAEVLKAWRDKKEGDGHHKGGKK